MIDRKKFALIKKYALDTDWNQAFSGASRGNRHLFRVVKVAEYLAQKYKARKDIVLAGAWLHDMSLPTGNDYDYGHNKKYAHIELKKFDLDNQTSALIAECIASHEGTVRPRTLEAKIVHDADVLEKAGFLGLIRHTWKITASRHIKNGDINRQTAREIIKHINWRGKKLFTPLARRIHNRFTAPLNRMSPERIEKIISEISRLVDQGLITEKISVKIKKLLTPSEQKLLRSQLKLDYLE